MLIDYSHKPLNIFCEIYIPLVFTRGLDEHNQKSYFFWRRLLLPSLALEYYSVPGES